MLVRVFQDEEILFEVGEMLKKVVQNPDVKSGMVQLLQETFSEPDSKDAVTNLLNESFNRILLDPETIDKFRIFTYNLMKAEIQGQGNKTSSLFDLMVKKAISRNSSDLETKSEIEDLLGDKTLVHEQPSTSEVEEKIEEVEKSVIQTSVVDTSVSDMILDNTNETDLLSALDKKIELENVNSDKLDSAVEMKNFEEDFVVLGDEISPENTHIGVSISVNDFEKIGEVASESIDEIMSNSGDDIENIFEESQNIVDLNSQEERE